jgi:hypothetical protein
VHPAEQFEGKAAKSVSQLKTVADLTQKFDQVKRARQSLERQWKLNLAFYKGKQYSFFPPRSDRLESLSTEEGEKPRHRVRIVSNQIIVGAHALLAQLTKTKPQFFAAPGSGSDHDIKASQMAQRLFEYWWSDLRLDEKLDEALLWSIIAGQGYWKVSWDPHAGKQMRFLMDPEGNPVVDDNMKDAFRAQLEQMGIPPQEKVVYLGDIKIEALSPFDVYLDPTARTFEQCKWAICVHHLDADEIKARWGKDVRPDSVTSSPDTSLPFANAEDAAEPDVRKVYIGYFLPSAAMPNGREVAWIDGADKDILEDKPWKYPTHDLPLIKFPGLRVPGGVYDDAPVTHSIPMQKELNKTISQIVEYKNLTINPVMIAPVGSLRTRRTNEPGQVLQYAPVGNMKPEFEALPSLPPYVFDHLNHISARLKEIFFSVDVLEGKVPPNVEAGIAIDLLQEMASDRLAPIIKLIELGLARSGQLMLGLAQQYYIEPRLLRIRGSGGSIQVKRFTQADINGGVTISAKVGSGLPRTRAGRQAQIERLVELQMVPPDKAMKFMELGDYKGLSDQMEADEDHAYREVEMLIKGQPINPEAIQAAMEQVNRGINPESGETLSGDPAEIQYLLQRASLQPGPVDNHGVHYDVLRSFMIGVEFQNLPPEIRQRFYTHAELTQAAMQQLPSPEAQAPRVNLQVKATTGPSVMAKILHGAGVDVTPNDTAEPPLETWVTDSVDKPDADAAGPGQEGEHLSKAAQIMLDSKIKAVEVQEKMSRDAKSHENDERRKDELHSETVRRARADASTAEKREKQSSFKPKPAQPKKKSK